MLRPVVLLALVACGGGSSGPAPITNTTPTPAATASTVTARCDRIAAEIAKITGGTDCCGYDGRRRIIGEHCTAQNWPSSVDVCGDPEPMDRLACPAMNGLDSAQNAAWSELFERLYGGTCPTRC